MHNMTMLRRNQLNALYYGRNRHIHDVMSVHRLSYTVCNLFPLFKKYRYVEYLTVFQVFE